MMSVFPMNMLADLLRDKAAEKSPQGCMPVIRLGKIARMRGVREYLSQGTRYPGKKDIAAGKRRDLIVRSPDDQGWDSNFGQSAAIFLYPDRSCQNQPRESFWILDAKFQGNAPPHGRAHENHPIQSELYNKPTQHLNGLTFANRTLTKTRHINGKNLQTQPGQKLKSTEFLPGCGLKFHPVQKNDRDSRRITALQEVNRKPAKIDIF
jgi:hypothetical protein